MKGGDKLRRKHLVFEKVLEKIYLAVSINNGEIALRKG